MTLGTHAAVGAAVAALVPGNPIGAFVLGFISHFLLDSIPHWDYKLLSLEKKGEDKMMVDMRLDRTFILDLVRIGFDILIGFVVAYFLFRNTAAFPYVLLWGSIGAMLPDVLQFVYFKWKNGPLKHLQRFHIFIHAEGKIHDPVKGISFQVIVVLCAYFISSAIRLFV